MRVGPKTEVASTTLLLGALISAGLTATSAFVSTTPVAAPSIRARQHHRCLPSSGGRKAGRPRTTGTRTNAPNSRRRPATPTATMLFGAGGFEGMAELGSVVSNAVGQTHASAMGSGLGTLLLADDPPAPPNIYGEVAQGGFFIIFSGVFSAYILATMIRNMPIDQLEALTAELGGGNEIADLEAQRIETTKRFKELTKDMAEAADPTMGVKPDERLSEKLSRQTAQALQTDIASIEDEYGD